MQPARQTMSLLAPDDTADAVDAWAATHDLVTAPSAGLMPRRAFLRMAAGATVGLPLALAGCGQKTPVAAFRRDFAILYGAETPLDIGRRLTLRAREQHVGPTLTWAGENGLANQLVQWVRDNSGLGQFDPATNSTPPSHGALVVPVAFLDVIEPLLATAMQRGFKVVAYPRPIRHQNAAIVIDAVRAATMLAEHAATWARARLGGRGDVLLAMPPAFEVKIGDPWAAAAAAEVQQAIRATLTRAAPGLRIAATLHGYLQPEELFARALAANPSVRMILTSDDTMGLNAAGALRAHHPVAARRDLYVGALGLPCVRSHAILREVERDDVLRAVVAAGPRDFANALIDVPRALLRGDSPGNVRLPLYVLAPGSSALRGGGYSADYLAHPPSTGPDGLLYNPAEERSPS
jgi:ABC-type sugar transport system substrate-binding protein